MIAQDFARVGVLGAFSPGARGSPSQEKSRKHSHALWWSEHVRARGQKCPTGGAFGSARGPAPPCEGAAAQVVSGGTSEKPVHMIENK